MSPEWILSTILVVTIVVQALLPSRRLLIVLVGAGLACLASALLGTARASEILGDVPWDVLVILVSLGLLSQLIAESQVFGILAARACAASRGDPRRLALLFTVGMYVMSSLVNNLTALLLVLPMLLTLFKLLGVSQRYLTWTLGALLVACNLGGAATPIGDFPAVLLLGRGSMTFSDYLGRAAPATALGLALLVLVVFGVARPERDVERSPISSGISVRAVRALYRHVRIDRSLLLPPSAALVAMLVAWTMLPASLGITPELVCWIGAGAALLSRPKLAEELLRKRIDIEAALILFALFVMVVAVRRSGMFADVASGIEGLPISETGQLVVFLLAAGVLTGLFSAGPGMAAMLEVADGLARTQSPSAVYVGLALSVCAGSSLFLTAATSGPLAQALTERADLRSPDGQPLRFGFLQFLPVGLVSFALIEGVSIGYALLAVRFGW